MQCTYTLCLAILGGSPSHSGHSQNNSCPLIQFLLPLLHVSSTSNITVCQPCVVVRSHTAVRSHVTSQMFECPQVPANYNLNTCFCLSSSLGQKQLVEYRAWYILLQESLVPMCGRIKALVSTVYTCTQISVLNMQRVEGKCHLCNHTLNGATVHHQ